MENSGLQTKIPKFTCPYCGQKFKIIPALKYHIITKHIQYNCNCPYCGKEFESLKDLKSHLQNINDKYHRNLFSLLEKKLIKNIDKKLFMENKGD